MSLEWQNQSTETPKLVEEIMQVERALSFEQKLSPEQIEEIMAMVQDINQNGVAFSKISSGKFEQILQDGILGSYEIPLNFESTTINKSDWVKRTKEDRHSNVYFNITGRQQTNCEYQINSSNFVGCSYDNIVILFDINNFKEEAPVNRLEVATTKNNSRKYRAVRPVPHPSNPTPPSFAAGEYDPDSCRGFALSNRVAPRYFKGIVAKFIPDDIWNKTHQMERPSLYGSSDERLEFGLQFQDTEYLYRLRPYLDAMLKNGKNIVPIYDSHGNLFFPKKMSHDEVKKFVAERDSKNINKEEK